MAAAQQLADKETRVAIVVLVVLVEVLHEIAQPLRPAVVAACHRALAPGGWLIVVDETYPGSTDELRDPAARFASPARNVGQRCSRTKRRNT